MQDAEIVMKPPVAYDSLWQYIGIGLIVLVVAWYGYVILVTRKRRTKKLNVGPKDKPALPDIPTLQQKYLQLIKELEGSYQENAISSRTVHQKLSLLVRYFAGEASGVKLHVYSLADLRRSKFPTVAKTIEAYYMSEFDSPEIVGDVSRSFDLAREVVQAWRS